LWLLSTLNMLGALRLLGNASYLQVFEADRLQVLARLNVAANFDDYYVGLPFFGLAATVCAYLWLKSGYIPRALAGFGVISSAWCVICAFVFLIFPHFNKIVNDYWFDSPMAIFEMVLSFWLLFKGLREPAGSKRPTPNPPTPKASAWPAPTCRAGAKAKEERPTSNAEGLV